MAEKLLSVIITTYNRELNIVKRAIASVKKQTYSNIEIIIVDDNLSNSKLSTRICAYCRKENIIYLKQFGNQGACNARNLGVANSHGVYIAFLDDDDEWLPSKASEQVNFLKKGYGLVFCKGLKIYTEPIYIEEIYGNAVNFIQTPNFQDLLVKNYVGTTSQIMITRECFYKVKGFDPNFLARQDYDFCIRVSRHYKLYGIDNILFKHYIHSEQQISKDINKTMQGYKYLFQKYKKYYQKNRMAYINICCKISKSYLHKNNYLMWIFIMLKALSKNPSKAKYIIIKSSEHKIL